MITRENKSSKKYSLIWLQKTAHSRIIMKNQRQSAKISGRNLGRRWTQMSADTEPPHKKSESISANQWQERQPQMDTGERRCNNNEKSASISENPRQERQPQMNVDGRRCNNNEKSVPISVNPRQERQPQMDTGERRCNNNEKSASISVNPRQENQPQMDADERRCSNNEKSASISVNPRQENQPQMDADERRCSNNEKSASISENQRQEKEEPKILRIERIFSGYQKRKVLEGISLEVNKGEVVAVIGKNGAGKSTLLKAIMGFLPVEEGEIYLNDTCITNQPPYVVQRKKVGYFMQGGRVFPHLTVGENLEVAGNGLTKKYLKNKIDKMSEMLPFLKSRSLNVQAAALSGGERHQLSLGMVLMNDLDLLLLDEPSAGLSPVNVDKMYELLESIKSEMALSMVLIEQKVTEAVKFSDRVCLLKNGKIEREEKSNVLGSIDDIGLFFFGDAGKNGLA